MMLEIRMQMSWTRRTHKTQEFFLGTKYGKEKFSWKNDGYVLASRVGFSLGSFLLFLSVSMWRFFFMLQKLRKMLRIFLTFSYHWWGNPWKNGEMKFYNGKPAFSSLEDGFQKMERSFSRPSGPARKPKRSKSLFRKYPLPLNVLSTLCVEITSKIANVNLIFMIFSQEKSIKGVHFWGRWEDQIAPFKGLF